MTPWLTPPARLIISQLLAVTPPPVMNPYRNRNQNGTEPGASPPSDHSSSSSSPPVIQTSQTFVSNSSAHQTSSDKGDHRPTGPLSNMDRSALPLPASDSGINLRSVPQSSLAPPVRQSRSPSPAPLATPNPYPALDSVSVIIPPSDPQPHPPLTSQFSQESNPDLECSICFSQFNNIFRCPKMLHCKHTFCLECLARINVKAAEPSTIQCPLCRGLTPLPALGLPRLATDPSVLSYLPAAMQRVYSIRFLRSKGKLEVKR